MTRENMSGFYKVEQIGGTFITATFFNPITSETVTKVVRDYDYSDCSRDDDELYHMPIDKAVRRAWMHHNGHILEGDLVEVVKGRKVRIGTVAKVVKIKAIRDRYNRWVADYAVFETGVSTNVKNCRLFQWE